MVQHPHPQRPADVSAPSPRVAPLWLAGFCALATLISAARGGSHEATALAAPRRDAVAPRGACPRGTVPDGAVCIHLESEDEEGDHIAATRNAHTTRHGEWRSYDQIPRSPGRPADYDAYELPVPPHPGGHSVMSGYDLDRPDAAQRRGRGLKHVGHGGIDIGEPRGTPVRAVRLEHQEGPSDVLYAGPLFGTTVVTRHRVREGGLVAEYVTLFAHLDRIEPAITPGRSLDEGAVLGAVGDSGSPGLVHLHLEIRRVREGVDLARVPGGPGVLADHVSVVCDPRNVLPVKGT